MTGLIITNAFNLPATAIYKIRRFKEEFALRNVKIIHDSCLHLPTIFKDGEIKRVLPPNIDFVIFLDKDKYISYAIESQVPMFNSAQSIELADDKMRTFMALRGSNIRTPKTIPAPLNYDPNPSPEYIEEWLNMVEEELSYPLICKECFGSMGKQVSLINNRDELNATYERLQRFPHVYQEFIEASRGKDYRLITLGDKVIAGMVRKNELDFRSNVALGGVGTSCVPKQSFVDMALKASHILGLDYAGVDILEDEFGNPILSEVNSNAFFTEIEKVTGVNVAGQFADYILERLAKIK